MLYDRWRQIMKERASDLALIDLAVDRRWTFQELAMEAEAGPLPNEQILFPNGNSSEFVITVLRGWLQRKVVCPVESAEQKPASIAGLPDEIVHLKVTSATGGISRLIAFTEEQLMADPENIVSTMGLRPDWPNLAVISLAHSYGFSNLVLPLLLHGVPLVLVGGALPELLRRAAAGQSAVTLPAVPALWQSWSETDAIPKNVRLAISAGAPLPWTLEEGVFSKHQIKIHNFYGSSECGGIAYDGSLEPRREAGYVGGPLRGVNVSVNEDGCLVVSSNAVGETYWPEASPALCEGVFQTSDLGEVSEGKIYLRGRAGDQINVAGRKVAPEAIELALASHPQVRGCLAFGVPSLDAQRGEMIVACVALTSDIGAQDLRKFALARLPAWQVPREWWVVDSLEANGRGKLSRSFWRKRYLRQRQTRS
ncbi:MAG TPA: fatty acid--CoA ligase family protein [Candidatus Limnocylindrales bacterium]|jgi:acyl-CoA synthetase (AMP-forming)/AMP-acid ligase II|nr:fatty acid--CoA ligase family protein [Candidatus Limnocylindrales bacterium]